MWTNVPSTMPQGGLLPGDLAACARLIRAGSKSFHTASLILPRDVRQGALALYAFCRVADDRVDEGADPRAALGALHRRLGGVYALRPENSPVDRSFAWVVSRYAIPRAVPEALLEGFSWDAEGRGYQTFADLIAYAVRVAGTVGIMMALVMGERRYGALVRAVDLGIAMQLTNIARDIGEDARAGRCYLPREWMEEAGVSMASLCTMGAPQPSVRGLVRRLLEAAQPYYESGLAGTNGLRPDCRAAIRAAALIYRDIGRAIEASDYDSLTSRAIVGAGRKMSLALLSLVLDPPGAASCDSGASGRDLIQAAARAQAGEPDPDSLVLEGWPWVMELFLDLASRQAGGIGGQARQRLP